MFLVVSQLDMHFGFERPFFARARKVVPLERNLSTPVLYLSVI